MDLKEKYGDQMKTLDDVKLMSASECPLICLSNGYSSLFGFLICQVTKDFWAHSMWLVDPLTFATQSWWFIVSPVDSYNRHSLKFWWNPDWTTEEKDKLQKAINDRIQLGKWKTRYDVWGVVGELLGWKWLNSKRYDFCSETMKFLADIDPDYAEFIQGEPHPTPSQIDKWLKVHPKYKVWGRVQPE